MVTVKDLGTTVELSILLPVEKKELGNTAGAVGYNTNDLKSYGFNVTMKTGDFISFVENVMAAHAKFQDDRAAVIKRQNNSGLDTCSIH